jgi:hypothetical protein
MVGVAMTMTRPILAADALLVAVAPGLVSDLRPAADIDREVRVGADVAEVDRAGLADARGDAAIPPSDAIGDTRRHAGDDAARGPQHMPMLAVMAVDGGAHAWVADGRDRGVPGRWRGARSAGAHGSPIRRDARRTPPLDQAADGEPGAPRRPPAASAPPACATTCRFRSPSEHPATLGGDVAIVALDAQQLAPDRAIDFVPHMSLSPLATIAPRQDGDDHPSRPRFTHVLLLAA